jgi:hypothetical protein
MLPTSTDFLAHLQQTNLARLRREGTAINWDEFVGPAGKEHYKLLSWLAAQYDGRDIFDIGTHRGASALALASGSPTNNIYSFDLEHKYPLADVANISYHLDNLMTEEGRAAGGWVGRLLGSAFIFLDIDPHEGSQEREFLFWLRDKGYKGFILCDDIWYFKGMRDNFWYHFPAAEKVDVTGIGHWSGTGIVRFASAGAETLALWPAAASVQPTNWTVVTAYFDLTKMPDASISIKSRPAEHYLAAAKATMSTEQNLVVFCEPGSVEALRAMRPAWLAEKTKFVPMSFEEFPLTQFRAKIQQNRREKPYAFDDRNTASYYLLCMARYAMLKQVIAENPFGSTHFSWLNICIERMGWRNLPALDEIWRAQREKFSTCWIDYQPEPLVRNLPEYFKWGRCGMCSGFFTGNAQYMKAFCDAMEDKFMIALEAGYGHADEQLFSMVYFDQPGLFDNYVGDYQEMITNYVEPRDRPYQPVRNVARNAMAHGNFAVCEWACAAVWTAWKKGGAALDDGQLKELITLYRSARQAQGKGATLP